MNQILKPLQSNQREPEPLPAQAEQPLGQLRLLIALDALLVEGSVKDAAAKLGVGISAMSRLLTQIRDMFGDEIFTRSGRGLVATPFAESLRVRLRTLANEVEGITRGEPSQLGITPAASSARPQLMQAPPLASRPAIMLEGEPDPVQLASRLAAIADDAPAQARLARYIATLGAGPGRSRPLSAAEAEDAFAIVLDGEAAAVQIGALLIALQYRGPTANELAGFVRAARRSAVPSGADLDWPAYLSPRYTRPPWFLHAARLVSRAGYQVLLHGYSYDDGFLSQALRSCGIRGCKSIESADSELQANRIAYLPLNAINPQIQALIALYRQFEMRSPTNQVVLFLNPLSAPATILGLPTHASLALHLETAQQLNWTRLLTIGTNRDVGQATPFRTTTINLTTAGEDRELLVPARKRLREARLPEGFNSLEFLDGLWTGAVRDDDAAEIVIATTACALMAAAPLSFSDFDRAHEAAEMLWGERRNQDGTRLKTP